MQRHAPDAVTVVTCATPERVGNGMLHLCMTSVRRQTVPVDAHLVGVDYGAHDQGAVTNLLVAGVTTEWLLVLDDDDWIEHNYVERMLRHTGEADMLYPDAWTSEENPIQEELNKSWDIDKLRRHNFIAGGVLMRTSLFNQIGGRLANESQNSDWHMWLAAYDAGARVKHVPEKLFNYRYHTGQKTWRTT